MSLSDFASLSRFAIYYQTSESKVRVLCGRHIGDVSPGGKATVRCREDSVGRYVTFQSEVSPVATLCEVVVIGRCQSRQYHFIYTDYRPTKLIHPLLTTMCCILRYLYRILHFMHFNTTSIHMRKTALIYVKRRQNCTQIQFNFIF